MSIQNYPIETKNVFYVSPDYDDSEVERFKKYRSIPDANNDIPAGYTMILHPGEYALTTGLTLKTGVFYYCLPGVNIIMSSVGTINIGGTESDELNFLGYANFINYGNIVYAVSIAGYGRANFEFNSISCYGNKGAFRVSTLGKVNIKGKYGYVSSGATFFSSGFSGATTGLEDITIEIDCVKSNAPPIVLEDIVTGTVPRYLFKNSYFELLATAPTEGGVVVNGTSEGSNVSKYTFQNCLIKNSHDSAGSHGIYAIEGHFNLFNVGIQTTNASSECVAGSCNVRSGNCIANESVGASVTQDVGAISVDAQFSF